MVSAAAENGATMQKFNQCTQVNLHIGNDLIRTNRRWKVKIIKRPYKDEYERLKKLDLEFEDHSLFLNLCKKYKIKPCTTIFSLSKIKMIDLKFET